MAAAMVYEPGAPAGQRRELKNPGYRRTSVLRPKGAVKWQPRATPWVPELNHERALKGRHKTMVSDRLFIAPLQGFLVMRVANPGRCPGLTCCCPFGATR